MTHIEGNKTQAEIDVFYLRDMARAVENGMQRQLIDGDGRPIAGTRTYSITVNDQTPRRLREIADLIEAS